MDPMSVFLVLAALAVVAVVLVRRSAARARARANDLAAVRVVAEEDVTRFGEELSRLDSEMLTTPLDEAMRQDYQRALDSYEAAKDSLRAATEGTHIRHVTEALEDGRYAVACVLARRDGRPLPIRRPPCFFNPAHGPSTVDVSWAPAAGVPRDVPVCDADAERLRQGAEPDVRTVPAGQGRVPYWEAGPAYSPWASGYFGAYTASNLLPTFLVLTLLSPTWDGGPVEGADTDFGVGDAAQGGDVGDGGAVGGADPAYGAGDEPRYAADDQGAGGGGDGWHDAGWGDGGFGGDFGGF